MAQAKKSAKSKATATSSEPIQDPITDEPTDIAEDQPSGEAPGPVEEQSEGEPPEDLEDAVSEPAPPVNTVPLKSIPEGFRALFCHEDEVYAVRSHEEDGAVIALMVYGPDGKRTRPTQERKVDADMMVEPL